VLRVTPSVGDHNASPDKHRDPCATGHADISHDRARALRREVLLMRAFQSRIIGPVLRRIAGPQNILEMGMAFWSSRVVLAAVEFGVFTQLAAGPLSGQELMNALGWHPRAAGPVLDALVALGLLRRDRAGRYSNSRRGALLFFDRAKPSYLGGQMELSSRRLFNLWSRLPSFFPRRLAIPLRAEAFSSE
jgi:Dimerisation domain